MAEFHIILKHINVNDFPILLQASQQSYTRGKTNTKWGRITDLFTSCFGSCLPIRRAKQKEPEFFAVPVIYDRPRSRCSPSAIAPGDVKGDLESLERLENENLKTDAFERTASFDHQEENDNLLQVEAGVYIS